MPLEKQTVEMYLKTHETSKFNVTAGVLHNTSTANMLSLYINLWKPHRTGRKYITYFEAVCTVHHPMIYIYI